MTKVIEITHKTRIKAGISTQLHIARDVPLSPTQHIVTMRTCLGLFYQLGSRNSTLVLAQKTSRLFNRTSVLSIVFSELLSFQQLFFIFVVSISVAELPLASLASGEHMHYPVASV
jgi:hypothetical protein